MLSPIPGMDPYIEAFGLWEDFEGSHYDRDLDYRRPLHPPLCPSDAAWTVSKWSPTALSKVTARIPAKIKKTALERAEDRSPTLGPAADLRSSKRRGHP